MPRADLRFRKDALDPLALVKVLAVMCFPTDVRGREAMMRRHPSHMTVLRHSPRQPALAENYAADLWADVAAHRRRGQLAGALCLALAQLSALGRDGEAAAVLSLAVDLAVRCEQAARPGQAIQRLSALTPPAEQEIFAAYRDYRGASHLWAVAVYGRIQLGQDLIPRTLQAVPGFLAYANEIARLSTALRWQAAGEPLVLSEAALWTLILPDALTRRAETEVRRPVATAPEPLLEPPGPASGTEAADAEA